MTILEKRSATRVKALKRLVDKGEYPVEYAIGKLDELNEKGLLTATDYEDTFDYFDEILNREEIVEESVANTEPISEENNEVVAENEPVEEGAE